MASSAKLRKYDPVSINVAILPDDDHCRKQKYWRISHRGAVETEADADLCPHLCPAWWNTAFLHQLYAKS